MALPTAYLTSIKDLEDFFNAIVTAQAPEQFSIAFLRKLDFTSSAHRLFIPLLKSLGFLTAEGAPTQRYYDYLDQSQSKVVLAEAIREAYGDLFAINKNAQLMELDEVKNKLRTLTQGKKTDDVIGKMANTFVALVNLADWTSQPVLSSQGIPAPQAHPAPETPQVPAKESLSHKGPGQSQIPIIPSGLHYNIQIHLPESRDIAVYDAIFRALKEHLF